MEREAQLMRLARKPVESVSRVSLAPWHSETVNELMKSMEVGEMAKLANLVLLEESESVTHWINCALATCSYSLFKYVLEGGGRESSKCSIFMSFMFYETCTINVDVIKSSFCVCSSWTWPLTVHVITNVTSEIIINQDESSIGECWAMSKAQLNSTA